MSNAIVGLLDAELSEGLVVPRVVVEDAAMQVHLGRIGDVNVLVLEHTAEEVTMG
jgi:hypothetical protein